MKTALVVAAVRRGRRHRRGVLRLPRPGSTAEARAAEAPWTARGRDVAAAELHRRGRARRPHLRGGRMVGETGRFLSSSSASTRQTTGSRFGRSRIRPGPPPGPRSTEDLRLRRGRRRVDRVLPTTSASGKTARRLAAALQRGRGAVDGRSMSSAASAAAEGCGGIRRPPRSGRSRPQCRSRTTFGAVAFEGGIWTFGGRRGRDPPRRLDLRPRRGEVDGQPRDAEAHGAQRDGSVGIEIHTVWEHTYQIYDAETGEWSQGPEPLVARHGLKAFAIDGPCTPWAAAPPNCTTHRS